jgi:hypothetical protein
MPSIEHQKHGDALFGRENELKRLQSETTAELAALLPASLTALKRKL